MRERDQCRLRKHKGAGRIVIKCEREDTPLVKEER